MWYIHKSNINLIEVAYHIFLNHILIDRQPRSTTYGVLKNRIHVRILHDDVIKWKHFPRNWPFVREIHRSPVNFPHKGQWRGALMFSLMYAWINDWVNNREAGDLRLQHGHYDVIVMTLQELMECCFFFHFHHQLRKWHCLIDGYINTSCGSYIHIYFIPVSVHIESTFFNHVSSLSIAVDTISIGNV